MSKRFIAISTIAALIMTSGCSMAAEKVNSQNGTKILYNGKEISMDTEPVNIDGTVMVPMRAIFEELGINVKWDGDTQTVSAKKKSSDYSITIGSKTITKSKNNETTNTVEALQEAQIIDGRTMLPLRALGEILGLDVEWDGDSQTVSLSDSDDTDDDLWKENTGTIDLDDLKVSGNGISVNDNIITINSGGDFTVTGKCDNGQIIVNTKDKVKLRLNGMSLTNTSGAPIYVEDADKLYITLESGTINTLADGGTYSDNTEIDGCIYSKDDVDIKGSGTLNITANVHHGITVKDSLEISNGTINITSVGDGIHVNDTCDISGGTINISSQQDGIQAEDILNITDGNINITCSGEVTSSIDTGFGGGRGQMQQPYISDTEADDSEDISSKGLKAGWMMNLDGGKISVKSNDTCIKCDSELNINGGNISLYSEVKKGIKGMEDININNGVINIEKSSEGIESKRILTINDGDIDITSSDDGMNGGGDSIDMNRGFGGGGRAASTDNNDTSSTPPQIQNDGNMRGPGGGRSHMPDGNAPEMNSKTGRQDMTPPDMPQMGGNDMTPPDMPQMGNGGNMAPPQDFNMNADGTSFGHSTTEISSDHHIQINGGNIKITAGGDGIDSNGSLVIDGGTVIVESTGNGDSALDHDGLFEINGGTVIGFGSSGMVENPSSSLSQQNILSVYLTSQVAAGSKIAIKNSSGKTIYEFEPSVSGGHIMFSSSDIKTGDAYTVYADGTAQNETPSEVTDTLTVIGSGSGFRGGMNGSRGGKADRLQETE